MGLSDKKFEVITYDSPKHGKATTTATPAEIAALRAAGVKVKVEKVDQEKLDRLARGDR